jgi:Leucine rich repeat
MKAATSKHTQELIEQVGAGTGMTPERIVKSCRDTDGFETPELNDKLYLHFGGFRRIENLEPYVNLKALWLEGNGLTKIEGLGTLSQLRSLFLGQNNISKIEGLEGCPLLVTLDLRHNMIAKVEGLRHLTSLVSLNLAKNALSTPASIAELQYCPSLATLDITQNELPGDSEEASSHAIQRAAATATALEGSTSAASAATTTEGEIIEEPDSVIAALQGFRRLTALFTKGNPFARDTRHYRKSVLASLPNLQYLDDRPVFEVERASVKAWVSSGAEGERQAREAFAASEKAEQKNSMERFKAWQESVRERRQKELADYNERARAEGEPEIASLADLPRKSFVSYGAVSEQRASEEAKMRRLLARAERVSYKELWVDGDIYIVCFIFTHWFSTLLYCRPLNRAASTAQRQWLSLTKMLQPPKEPRQKPRPVARVEGMTKRKSCHRWKLGQGRPRRKVPPQSEPQLPAMSIRAFWTAQSRRPHQRRQHRRLLGQLRLRQGQVVARRVWSQ